MTSLLAIGAAYRSPFRRQSITSSPAAGILFLNFLQILKISVQIAKISDGRYGTMQIAVRAM
jgi:hypothetical protein